MESTLKSRFYYALRSAQAYAQCRVSTPCPLGTKKHSSSTVTHLNRFIKQEPERALREAH